MNLKPRLDSLTMESAVLGGAVLGGGGGGKLEDGLYLGELATTQGYAELAELNNLSRPAHLAIVGSTHSSGTDTYQISPHQVHQAIDSLQSALTERITGLINAGVGAVDTILGWVSSGYLSVPLLDISLPETYHPLPLRNLFLFLAKTDASRIFTVALAGRLDESNGHRQHLWHGHPAQVQKRLDELRDDELESYVFAGGPFPLSSVIGHSHSQTISNILKMGQLIVTTSNHGGQATAAAVQDLLLCSFSTFATVTGISWHGQGEAAYGVIKLRGIDKQPLTLIYSQRYLELLEDEKQLAAFPDRIITLGTLGTPLTGEEVFIGQDLYLLVAALRN